MSSTTAASVEAAFQAFQQWMAALQAGRAGRGDPWAECPMTIPQLRALGFIAAAPTGRTSRELANLLGVGASAVTPLVDRLVEHGFVERREDPHDRRIARLTATQIGAATLERVLSGKGELMREALSRLTDDQLELVTQAFSLLRASLQPLERNWPS